MKKVVPALFAFAGVGFLIPAAKSLIKGEPIEDAYLVFGMAFLCLTLAVVLFGVGRRKSGGGSGPRSA